MAPVIIRRWGITVMARADERTIRQIADILGRQPGVRRVLLFGSRADGSAREDSDVDLLVICEGHPRKLETILHLRSLLPRRRFGIDLFVMGEDEFEETKGIIGGLSYPANRTGMVLYEHR